MAYFATSDKSDLDAKATHIMEWIDERDTTDDKLAKTSCNRAAMRINCKAEDCWMKNL